MARLRKTTTKGEALELRRALDEAQAARSKELLSVGRWRGVVVWGPPGFEGDVRQECEF